MTAAPVASGWPARGRVDDLRMPLLGAAAWAGGLLGVLTSAGVVAATLAGPVALLVPLLRRRREVASVAAACVLVASAVAGSALLRGASLAGGPVPDLAAERAVVALTLTVTSDPRPTRSRYGEQVVLRARLDEVVGRGRAYRTSTPVVLLAEPSWSGVSLGAQVRASGRLSPADGDVAALVSAHGSPQTVQPPDAWWRAASVVRTSIREAVAPRAEHPRELVPALVVGDDAGVDPDLADDFRTTGLTHLLAVSGTNLTLLVGFLLVVTRWVGLRGRWLQAVAGLGIVGFVLLARTEPSVVRAAAMGTVALVGLGTNGLARGTRCLGVAVVALLLVDPHLSVSPGFALSVLATAGILLLAPRWRSAMGWLPRWAAEAVSVPAAAQLACTPVVASLSGEVSLVAVVANLLAAPAVAPATVLGLAGGLVGLLWMPLGQVVAAPAAWSVAWIVEVAQRGADLPTAAVGWGTGAVSLTVLTALCLAGAWGLPRLLRHPVTAVGCCTLLVVAVLTRPPTPGWPPPDWLVAMCDVGQGDALALRAGPQSAVVVDAGPDPALVDRCLDRLEVEAVPLVVLTHFHADHVDGLSGVLEDRAVDAVVVSPLAAPAGGARAVRRVAAAHGLSPFVAAYDATSRVGSVSLQVLWPPEGTGGAGVVAEAVPEEGEGSAPNDASVVLLAEVGGLRVLLTGDVEAAAQAGLARQVAQRGGLDVDVLKVPHHGSSDQVMELLTGVDPELALVSVGEDNGYGHPAPHVVAGLEAAGASVLRTDRSGDVLVVVREGEVRVATRGVR